MRVSNMESHRGNKVPNQFIINHEGVTYFQSYDTVIAKKQEGKITLDEGAWDYSRTTMKYLGIFLGKTAKDIRNKVTAGEYQMENLNE